MLSHPSLLSLDKMLSHPLSHYQNKTVDYPINRCAGVTLEPLDGEYYEEDGCMKGRMTIKSFGTDYAPVKVELYTRVSTGKYSSTLAAVGKLDPMLAYFCAEVAKQELANNLGR